MDNLIARREAVTAELAALSAATAGGRPNINGGGMGMVDHVGYKDALYRELRDLNLLIDQAQGPWELPLEGHSA